MRYFIELSYLGTSYNGWQRQKNAPSVQQTIEEALSKLLRTPTEITGAGRTDTGVHAAYYVAHFDAESPIADTETMCYRLNAVLPEDIAVSGVYAVSDNAHTRFDAVEREYKYYILRYKNPFNRRITWQYYVDLDIDAMNRSAASLTEYSDFTTFSKLHSNNKTNICSVHKALWHKENDMLIFTISADRFLRNMVRSVVGTLVDVGRGKISVEEFREIALSQDRSRASGSAPAQGLFLTDVVYPQEVFKRGIKKGEN